MKDGGTTAGDPANAAENVHTTEMALRDLKQAKVVQSALTSSVMPVHDQFAFWREAGAGAGIIDRNANYSDPFSAGAVNYVTSTVLYARHYANQQSTLNRSKKCTENFGSDTMAIQLRVSGFETANNFETGELFKPGDIRIFDMSQPYFADNLSYDNIAFLVQKKDLMGRFLDLEALHGKILPSTAMTAMLSSYMKSAITTIPELNIGELQRVNDATFEMLGAAILGAETPEYLESEDTDGIYLQALRMFIERNLGNPNLSPDMIARGTAMSRSKLFRICKQYGTPMELVRYRRLRRAADYMRARDDMSIEQISYAVGFRNRESFSRAFKAEFGMSPGAFSGS